MPAEKLESGEVYKGPCGILKDSQWLSAETIPADRDMILQIEKVVRRKSVKFKNETKVGYGSLKFVGKERELGLNATNIRILAALFGSDTGEWFGQHVALYVDPAVSAFGQIVSAVRIRAKHVNAPKPKAAGAKETDPERDALLTRISNASDMLELTELSRNAVWSTHCGTLKPTEATIEQLGNLAESLESDAMQRGEVGA